MNINSMTLLVILCWGAVRAFFSIWRSLQDLDVMIWLVREVSDVV